MNEKTKALAKQHGPTVAIVAVGVVAAKLMLTPSSPSPPPQLPTPEQLVVHRVMTGNPPLPARFSTAATARPSHHEGVETRVVSCGGRGAKADGDDSVGTVTIGTDGGSTCTVLFENQKSSPPSCVVNGGHLAKTLTTEFVIDQIDGKTATYRCQ